MRNSTVFGIFLLVLGLLLAVLRPTYRGRSPAPTGEVEADGPVAVYHPVPGWVTLATHAGGVALVVGPRLVRGRGGRRR